MVLSVDEKCGICLDAPTNAGGERVGVANDSEENAGGGDDVLLVGGGGTIGEFQRIMAECNGDAKAFRKAIRTTVAEAHRKVRQEVKDLTAKVSREVAEKEALLEETYAAKATAFLIGADGGGDLAVKVRQEVNDLMTKFRQEVEEKEALLEESAETYAAKATAFLIGADGDLAEQFETLKSSNKRIRELEGYLEMMDGKEGGAENEMRKTVNDGIEEQQGKLGEARDEIEAAYRENKRRCLARGKGETPEGMKAVAKSFFDEHVVDPTKLAFGE